MSFVLQGYIKYNVTYILIFKLQNKMFVSDLKNETFLCLPGINSITKAVYLC